MSKNSGNTGTELSIGYNDFWFERVEDATAAFTLLSAAIHVTSGYTDRSIVREHGEVPIRLVKSNARLREDILSEADYEAAKAAADAKAAAESDESKES